MKAEKINRARELGYLLPEGFSDLPAGVEASLGSLESSDKRFRLSVLSLSKVKSAGPKRVLVVFHGFGEHGGRYWHLGAALRQEFDLILMLDHRGHGRSEGLRGDAESFSLLVEDAAQFLKNLDQIDGCPPVKPEDELHILGHSMGGLLTFQLLQTYPHLKVKGKLRSVILSAPLFEFGFRVPLIKRLGSVVLEKVWSTIQLPNGIEASELSHDTHVVETYLKDRLNHSKITPRFFASMRQAMQQACSVTREGKTILWNYPLLMIVGNSDKVTSAKRAKKIFSKLPLPQKQLVEYDGCYHEPLNETIKESVFEEIRKWISKTSPHKTPANSTSSENSSAAKKVGT